MVRRELDSRTQHHISSRNLRGSAVVDNRLLLGVTHRDGIELLNPRERVTIQESVQKETKKRRKVIVTEESSLVYPEHKQRGNQIVATLVGLAVHFVAMN